MSRTPDDVGLSWRGLVGMGAYAKLAVVNSSITNFVARTGWAPKD